jgi:radical SAM superfamily enzyme YgiQ (UPF0313 family)
MKVLFVYPNTASQPGFNYGIAYLSAVLKKAGHRVELIHVCEDLAPLPTEAEFVSRVRLAAPDLIGFSVVTNQWPVARQLASWARKAVDAPLVCGGIHAMATPQQILKTGLFDYVIRGEAESAMLDLVDRLAEDRDTGSVNNVAFMRGGRITLNPLGPLPDLNALPPKDYSVFDFQRLVDAKNGWVGLLASRGCPFACTYCFNRQVVKHYRRDLRCSFGELNYIRHHEVDAIISEIRLLLENYHHIRMFIFDDDLFTYNIDFVKEFCREYKKNCTLPFTVNAHVGFFDGERAGHLSDANCRIVKFGVESGSARVRKQILQRHMSNTQINEAIQTAKRYGLHASIFVMIGLPDESRSDLMETVALLAGSLPGRFRWSFFFPYPDTKAHDLAVEKGLIATGEIPQLKNFTDRSGLDFGKAHNLFLEKLGAAYPWFVNARADWPAASIYRKKVDDILRLDADAWRRRAPTIAAKDREISARLVKAGIRHYAIKYNRFMGVISDYFTKEDE